jgi:hypothetical protein
MVRACSRPAPKWMLAALLLFACSAKLKPTGGGGDGGSAQPGGAGPGIGLPDGGGTSGEVSPSAPGAGEQCAEEILTGEMVPVDLMLVIDASGSMRVMVGGKTRWEQVTEGLGTFVRDPRSTGLGVGLQTFPFTIYQKPCQTDADCDSGPSPMAGNNYWCAPPYVCNGPGVDLSNPRTCDPNDAFCPEAGTHCERVGRCAQSGARCTAIGQDCPAGGGRCNDAPTVCKMEIDSCVPADYEPPKVAIADLPTAAGALMQGMGAIKPGGNTPITPAITGAAKYLRTYLAAHPGHRGALVLATDVSPSGCKTDTIADVAAAMTAARQATPSIPTYVIGAISLPDPVRADAAKQLATAGGTAAPFIVNDSAADLGSKFLDALAAIRGSALTCEFRIPTPTTMTGTLDYNKVNVRFMTPASGDDLVYVGNAAACTTATTTTKVGWYYDVDPSKGTPSTIKVCDATCARIKAEAGGTVQLRFGCRTRVE